MAKIVFFLLMLCTIALELSGKFQKYGVVVYVLLTLLFGALHFSLDRTGSKKVAKQIKIALFFSAMFVILMLGNFLIYGYSFGGSVTYKNIYFNTCQNTSIASDVKVTCANSLNKLFLGNLTTNCEINTAATKISGFANFSQGTEKPQNQPFQDKIQFSTPVQTNYFYLEIQYFENNNSQCISRGEPMYFMTKDEFDTARTLYITSLVVFIGLLVFYSPEVYKKYASFFKSIYKKN